MKNTLLEFMEKTGKQEEFKLFLNEYSNLPKMKFAVIKIGGKVLENKMGLLAEDIAYLNKQGIYPIIVHGGGSILDERLGESIKSNGIRITSESDMETVKEVFSEVGNELKKGIIANGGNAERVEGIFECEVMEEFGFVGRIKSIDLFEIEKLLEKNITPIIFPIGRKGKTWLNVNADTAAKELVKAICPKRFILITETGGILDENKQVIPFINLSSDEEFKQVTGGMLLKVREIKELLKSQNNCGVVITSAENLLKEIFTIKGSGTLIKYHRIESVSGFELLDKEKMKWLVEDAFGKKLVCNYFDNEVKEILFQKDFEGAIVIQEINGISHVDKFVVAKAFQGTGLGKSLWNEVLKRHDKLIWRASPSNSFNCFYMKNCDGFIKCNEWNVYWKNLNDGEILPAVKKVANMEKTVKGEWSVFKN